MKGHFVGMNASPCPRNGVGSAPARVFRGHGTLSAFLVLTFVASAVGAEEPDHLQFARALRERHYSDLALKYLKKLDKKKLPPDVAAVIPLEIAKCLVARTQEIGDLGEKATLYAEARAQFRALLADKPSSRLTMEANLDLARLIRLEGRSALNHALRQETREARRALAQGARPQFEEADKLLKTHADQIGAILGKSELRPDDKQALERMRIQAEFERGLNLYDQAETYDDTEEAVKRGEVLKQAMTALRKVAAGDAGSSLALQARAWIGRCFIESDDPKNALTELAKVINDTSPQAEPAKRLAKYFQLLVLDKDPTRRSDPLAAKLELAGKWLQQYPDEINTAEGNGVRFQIAEVYFSQALGLPKTALNQLKLQRLYADAEKLYEAVERSESELSKQAHERRLSIILTRSGERSRGDISQLKDFTECYLRAQVEIAGLSKEEKDQAKSPKDPKKLEENRKQHHRNLIVALNRALDLADEKTDAKALIDSRYLLSYAYLLTNDPYRAVVVGEDLARTAPKASQSSKAAGYAIQAYSQIISRQEAREASSEQLKTDRERAKALAEYMIRTWPADPATNLARHQLGLLAMRDKNYPEAVSVLSEIAPSFSLFAISQYQLAVAALQAEKEGVKPPAGQPSYQQTAAAALTKVADPASNADSVTLEFYFHGKIELAKIMFANKQYQAMDQLIEQLKKRFTTANLEDSVHKKLQPAVELLSWYAKYGQCEEAFRTGSYASVHQIADPIVKALREKKPADLQDPQLLRRVLGLALRAKVQEGKVEEAKEILDLLQKSTSDAEGGTTAILVELVQQLKNHVDDLRAKGPKHQAELDKTIQSFSAFLDKLANQPADSLTPPIIRFLAFSYAGLDKHDRAADLLAKIPAPEPSKESDAEKRDKENADKEAFYHSVRLMYVRELRLSKDFEKTDQQIQEILTSDWGKRNLDARKERIYLLEDQEKFAAAFRLWNEMMKEIKPQMEKTPRLKDQYFDCYYHLTYCYYKNGLKLADESKKQAAIKRAAGLIVDLEKKKPDRGSDVLFKKYDELLQKENLLKQEYDEQKKNSP